MADKTCYLVSHFFVSSDCFLQFESLRDFAFRGGCCSTVLVNVNRKKLSLKIKTIKVRQKCLAFFFCPKRNNFSRYFIEMFARGLHLQPDYKIDSHCPNSATLPLPKG